MPAVLALELLTTVLLLPKVWRQADWRSLRWLIAGSVCATPLGLLLLAGPGDCRAWGRARVEAKNGLRLGAKHSHA